jgi:hypothetical protein
MEVTARQLKQQTAQILARVQSGETVTPRRSGAYPTSPSGRTSCWPDSALMSEPVATADTSALIAFFNEADKHHQDYRHFRMIRPLTPHDVFRLLPDDITA